MKKWMLILVVAGAMVGGCGYAVLEPAQVNAVKRHAVVQASVLRDVDANSLSYDQLKDLAHVDANFSALLVDGLK
jgi:hypothetical protein